MSRARALVAAVIAAAAFAAHVALRPPRAPDAADAAAAAALGIPESGVALLAGAFKPIAADLLWMRILEHQREGEYEEILPLAQALLAIDPGFERAWVETAWTIAIDIPAFEDDPDVIWAWRRQGFLLLRDGARKNPGSWRIPFWEARLADVHVARDPALVERFRADRALNPEGLDPVEWACRRYREAQARPDRPKYVDDMAARLGCPPLAAPRPN